jgi:hypothetical protein
MDFEIVGEIISMETIASGSGVRERTRLRRQYGQGRWRKRKGVARVRLVDGTLRLAEIHWYEAHGIGRRESSNSNSHFLMHADEEHRRPDTAVCFMPQ